MPKSYEIIKKEELVELNNNVINNAEYEYKDLFEIDQDLDFGALKTSLENKVKNNENVAEIFVKLFFDCLKRRDDFTETIWQIQNKIGSNLKLTTSLLIESILAQDII